jgi:hypothetical protein
MSRGLVRDPLARSIERVVKKGCDAHLGGRQCRCGSRNGVTRKTAQIAHSVVTYSECNDCKTWLMDSPNRHRMADAQYRTNR